jgi:CRISPR system Cascade subunit CasE
MYLSCLLINVGTNPDRPRPGRLWLRNLYRVHQRLAMAFPTDPRKEGDKQFLKPYKSDDFPEDKPAIEVLNGRGDIHEERSDENGFLFRIDHGVEREESALPPVLLVQSAKRPGWDYAFGLKAGLRDPETGKPVGNAGCLLAASPETKRIEYEATWAEGLRVRVWSSVPNDGIPRPAEADREFILKKDEELKFRLNANPTRRLANGPFEGHRVSVGRGPQAILGWLARKGEEGGFKLIFEKTKEDWDPRWRIVTGMTRAWKEADDGDKRKEMSFAYANVDGVLAITDAQAFAKTLRTGVGPAKAFGFGLLSLDP